MRFLLAGTLATLTAAGLATIRPAVVSDEERAAAPDFIGLGPGVLRAETAAVTAGALLVALRHGVVNPV